MFALKAIYMSKVVCLFHLSYKIWFSSYVFWSDCLNWYFTRNYFYTVSIFNCSFSPVRQIYHYQNALHVMESTQYLLHYVQFCFFYIININTVLNCFQSDLKVIAYCFTISLARSIIAFFYSAWKIIVDYNFINQNNK